jgi:hypothetical protein
MQVRVWPIICAGAVSAVILACSAAVSVDSETTLPPPMASPFDVQSTVAPLRGGKIESALRPIPPIHNALWPPIPVFL